MQTLMEYIKQIAQKYFTIPNIFPTDIIEIIIITIIVYYLILWLRKSRAWVLFKGIMVLVVFMLVASLFHLSTLLWIINKMLNVGIIAVVIIFQPELRRALESLGKGNIAFKLLNFGENYEEKFSDKSIEEIIRAVNTMAKAKTGALIVLGQEHDLGHYIDTGIRINAKISSQLLINIFEKNTPLHDGAVIIEEDKIIAATCYLPLTDSIAVSKELGTRHRAALGLTEMSDSVAIIVSEETGSISIAREGKLIRYADAGTLKKELTKAQKKEKVKSKLDLLKGLRRNEKNIKRD